MKRYAYYILGIMLALSAYADNGVSGSDQPWDNDDDDPTSAVSQPLTTDNDTTATVWYDLQGRRLEGKPSQRGIYIRNGKKYFIR